MENKKYSIWRWIAPAIFNVDFEQYIPFEFSNEILNLIGFDSFQDLSNELRLHKRNNLSKRLQKKICNLITVEDPFINSDSITNISISIDDKYYKLVNPFKVVTKPKFSLELADFSMERSSEKLIVSARISVASNNFLEAKSTLAQKIINIYLSENGILSGGLIENEHKSLIQDWLQESGIKLSKSKKIIRSEDLSFSLKIAMTDFIENTLVLTASSKLCDIVGDGISIDGEEELGLTVSISNEL